MIRNMLESAFLDDLYEERLLRLIPMAGMFLVGLVAAGMVDINTGAPAVFWLSMWLVITLSGWFVPQLHRLSYRYTAGPRGSDIIRAYQGLSKEDKALFGPDPKPILRESLDSPDVIRVRQEFENLLDAIERKNQIKAEATKVIPDMKPVIEDISDRRRNVQIEIDTYVELR